MNENLSLGRIAGIHVGLNWSVLVVGALIAWSLAVGSLPYAVPGQGAAAYWIAGVLASVLFLASLLAHELAHSIVAQRMGVRVQGITLWLFGGVSRLDSEANSPRSEAVITFVGPLTSLILGALFLIASLGLGSGPTPSLVAATCSWLGTINFILGFFNLIPAAPLDGGRLLHALIWARTGDALRATTIASRVGMGFGILLIAYGLVTFLVTGNLFNGVWSVFLGWFLLSAARAEESSGLIRQALAGVHVAEVMTPDPVQASDALSVEDLLHTYVLGYRHSTFPVHDQAGSLTGLVTLSAVKKVSPDDRPKTAVREIRWPLDQVPQAARDDLIAGLLGRLGGCSDGRALVVDGGRLVGIVTPTDINRALQRWTLGRSQRL